MALSASELTEVAPKTPIGCCVVGDYVVANQSPGGASGLMPNGAFSVMDTGTETALAYSGLDSSNWQPNTPDIIYAFAMVAGAGYAWAVWPGVTTVSRITVTTGAITNTTLGSHLGNRQMFVTTAGGYVVAFSGDGSTVRLCQMSTLTASSVTATHSVSQAIASDGTYVYWWSSNTWRRLDPASGTVTTVGTTGAISAFGRGVVIGGIVWVRSATALFAFNPSTGITATHSHTHLTGGDYATFTDLVAHSDGNIYGYGGSDYLIGFNPSNGLFGKEALSPSRSRRYTVASAAGKLWIPSGEPLT